MNLLITLCASILSAHPGCTITTTKLLSEVTPQTCINKAQEYIAQEMPKLYPGYRVVNWGCKKRKMGA